MIDFIKEMESILETDTLGLLEVKPKASSAISADERLIASFEEIIAFVREHNREPAKTRDISERKLYSRLKGLRENPEKAAALAASDTLHLLGDVRIPEPKAINTIDDVLEDDVFGLLGDDLSDEADLNDIFNLKNVPKPADTPDYIAKRKPCEEFGQFEPLFKQTHAELASKKKVLRSFSSEQQITSGAFFILQGMMVYVANVGKRELRNFGNTDARLYCVFENGTESNLLLRSLASALWKDETSRQIVDDVQMELFGESEQITPDDKATGYIYVLQSLSEDPQIREIRNLYKIGFSSQPIKQRIRNAKQEPTCLMADVKLVTEFETYNLNPQKLEMLLHTFFAESCLNLDVFDSEGKRHTPREWFIVPLHVIETAVRLLINGDIVNYHYDSQQQKIVEK
ncbi:GIY-YIG nuclease family protein [Desulfonema magnum]|uniref:Bacteriophage T5/ORF172 domain-containing protein n=1 Tax=Desulfonema magnum TaxID=45655 RepID=A0A975BY24_9BACT|nr:GIY-YIG nuclease family protein [Desulfonema magnum]QTA93438.1 bacteriophage T5/ORF172 domain-containing protein [Desulfonema magnum]